MSGKSAFLSFHHVIAKRVRVSGSLCLPVRRAVCYHRRAMLRDAAADIRTP